VCVCVYVCILYNKLTCQFLSQIVCDTSTVGR